MDTYKKVITHLDPSDRLEVACGNIIIDITLSEEGKPLVVVDCPQGLLIHQYRKAEGVRHGGFRMEPESILYIHRGYEGPSIS